MFPSCFAVPAMPSALRWFDTPQADTGELPALDKLMAAFKSRSKKKPQDGQTNVLSLSFKSFLISPQSEQVLEEGKNLSTTVNLLPYH